MKQLSFSDAEYGGKRKRTRREVFLAEMHRAVPWSQLMQLELQLFELEEDTVQAETVGQIEKVIVQPFDRRKPAGRPLPEHL